MSKLIIEKKKPICILTLNRPEIHNAFDDELIKLFLHTLEIIEHDSEIRVVILKAKGKSFSAGADLKWMQRMVNFSKDENLADSHMLATLLYKLATLNKPTLVQIQGSTFGGGIGLVACCDIAIAVPEANFCFSETRLGLIPAVISPYVIAAMGARQTRRYFLTAEIFSAEKACELGLIHQVVPQELLETCISALVEKLLQNSPAALSEAKQLIDSITHKQVTDSLIQQTAEWIARLRTSNQGQEGIHAFLQKRKANWVPDDK